MYFQWVFGAPFVNSTIPYTQEEEFFSSEIMTVWTDFAKYGYSFLCSILLEIITDNDTGTVVLSVYRLSLYIC